MKTSILYPGRTIAITVCVLFAGCANLTVTKVTPANDSAAKGLRYYLPKPYLQATPQADGTVSFDVIFLPDKSQMYAIDTSSYGSTYTFQAARDEKGLLTALEFKASTAAVGQQLASSAGAYATQAYNIKAAGAVAQQTQVNTAQTAVDAARSTLASAQATLVSDQANNAKTETLTADFTAVASAKAKLEIAEQVLQRAQNTSQVVSNAVTASSPLSTTGPSMGTAFVQPTWNPPVVVNLPERFGPVLYALNDDGKTVNLVAVKAKLPDSTVVPAGELQKGVVPDAQPTFKTTNAALGPPSLFPGDQTVPTASKQATYIFDRPIKALTTLGSSVTTDATPPTATTAVPKLSADGKSVTVDITGLQVGRYVVTVKYSYMVDSTTMPATKQVKLNVIQ